MMPPIRTELVWATAEVPQKATAIATKVTTGLMTELPSKAD
jgi:hypothetical protein